MLAINGEQEEIRDLMVTDGAISASSIHIREVVGGGVCLAGATEKEVQTREEMAQVLEQGSLLRATGSTGMNRRSSRSHAIFTITLEQRRIIHAARTARGTVRATLRCRGS
jgi:Kinesin motor domain